MLRCSIRAPLTALHPHTRLLTTSRRHLARSPTFTTPAPAPAPSPSPATSPNGPLAPLPPTDLPVEDYASPLLHTASFFSQLFRYAVFGSVGIVALGLGGLAGVHLWVEKVEMASGVLSEQEDPERWSEDAEGWSGAHRGGGTDPRLGILARSAIRGAWISQHWGGGVASPISPSSAPSTSTSASPFAASRMGGQMIAGPKSLEEPSLQGEVGDAGWRMAEQYLLYALRRAEGKGISLALPVGAAGSIVDQSDTSITFTEGGGGQQVDRAALELEQRLASLRERMGGRHKLHEAYEGWERIYYALSSSSSTSAGWEQREKLKATRKLGELSARLGALWRQGTEERRREWERAEGWFVGGLRETLGVGAETTPEEEVVKKAASPKASFFAFWSRSHPTPSSTSSSASSSAASPIPLPLPYVALSPPLSSLLSRLSSLPLSPSSTFSSSGPATDRALLASLIALETHLARSRNLPAAHSLQSSALLFARSLLPHSATEVATLPPGVGGKELQQLYVASRTAVLSIHLAEVSLALRPSLSSALKAPLEPAALELLQGGINTSQAVLDSLAAGEGKNEKHLEKARKQLRRDARVAGGMGCSLVALVHEMGPVGKGGKAGKWYGGAATAEVFYAKGVEFLSPSLAAEGGKAGKKGEEEEELPGCREAREGESRCRAKVKAELGEK